MPPRQKKEKIDPICTACRERNNGTVAEWQCTFCKEEQAKFGRRAWTTTLQMGQVHLGDMNELGEQIPDDSMDVIFTDPVYLKEVFEDAYAHLAELACRVLKPYGFLFMYAPQTHLDEIMDLVRYSNTTSKEQILHYFWVIESLNGGKSTAKNHQRNAICLHKPILVFQKAPSREEMKGARKCFADVVRGLRQKKFHPWQQSVHDVLGIISRFMVPGERLLDPYAGTGTSLIAGQLLGMDVIGFEIDEKTHAIAVREMQQQPMDLFTFGGEEPEIPAVREVSEEKDASRQSSIEEPTDPAKEARPVELKAACLRCKVMDGCTTHDPYVNCKKIEAGKKADAPKICIHHGTDGCPLHDVECDGTDATRGCHIDHPIENPEELQEYLLKYTTPMQEKKKRTAKRTDPSCMQCGSFDNCKTKNKPHSGCAQEAQGTAPAPVQKAGGPTPGTCGTCGHHKGRKTFHPSCPRLGELLFKGGTKSAKVLMQETERDRCEHWVSKEEWAAGQKITAPGKIPGAAVCTASGEGTEAWKQKQKSEKKSASTKSKKKTKEEPES